MNTDYQKFVEESYELVPKHFREGLKGVLYKENVVIVWLDLESQVIAYV